MCLYNGEEYLAETVKSALAQTFTDFELIAVDDGSTDGSVKVLEGFTDARIRLVRQRNQGTAGAIQTGLREARGELIAFLDQDDIWEPESLATQVEFLRTHPEIDLSFSWFRIIDANGHDMGVRSARYEGTIGFRELLQDFVIGGNSNVVARRKAIDDAGGVDTELRIFFNMDMALRISLLRRENNVSALPRDLMRYRRHPSQLSKKVDGLKAEWLVALAKLERLAPEPVAAVKAVTELNFLRYLARVHYEAGRFGAALGELREGFGKAPAAFCGDVRNWLTLGACFAGLALPRQWHRGLERMAGLRR